MFYVLAQVNIFFFSVSFLTFYFVKFCFPLGYQVNFTN
jgi:hypothetical protein